VLNIVLPVYATDAVTDDGSDKQELGGGFWEGLKNGTDLACATLAVGIAYYGSVLCFAHPVGTAVCSFCLAWGLYRGIGGIFG
jgi:hypothetical protein